ncbi:MAG: gamma-glutamyl-gamma-aminobutyrate hydrolase family protein [Synergistaceae bacterium]|jgi:putative glutamine amidotransferase|nr:gamma-glutamyl-gamma-aminobutyrate hydrolase family protein [Synergistaceae bacterium]
MARSKEHSYPIVGIGANVDDDQPGVQNIYESYVEAVYSAGCLPLIIPLPNIKLKHMYESLAERAVGSLDAILLSGGDDVDAALYGEENMPYNGSFSEERDLFEIALARRAARMRKPVLGICRGVQILNVAMGGTLYQDIEHQSEGKRTLMHRQKAPSYSAVHKVKVRWGSRVASLLLDIDELEEKTNKSEDGFVTVDVNSFHHQAVKDVAPGFAATAFAPDGIIEAIEPASSGDMHPFTLGVQWHPERMWKHHSHAERLFKQLAEAAGEAANTSHI